MSRALCSLLVCAMLGLLGLVTGCSTSTRIYVKSTDQTNDGNTLYMMVRSTDSRALSTESYQEAVSKLFSDPQDPTVVASQPIFPGNTASVTLEGQDAKDVAVYFFFTAPGASWRVPLRKPLPAEVYIDLGQHQIERVQIRKR